MPEDCFHIKLEVAYNNWDSSYPIMISLLFPLSTLDQFHSTVIQTIQVYIYIYIYIYIIYIIYILKYGQFLSKETLVLVRQILSRQM